MNVEDEQGPAAQGHEACAEAWQGDAPALLRAAVAPLDAGRGDAAALEALRDLYAQQGRAEEAARWAAKVRAAP